jgi:glycine cleavage system H lipoate-binding protein
MSWQEVTIMTILLMLAFFAAFILVDYALTRRRVTQEAAQRIPVAESSLEPVWVAGYRLPEELRYHPGHVWVRPLDRATVLVGLDDFARRLIGAARGLRLPARGDWLHQGGAGFGVKVDGRAAEFLAPVEGEVVAVNPELRRNPSLATDDPYGRGWVMKVRVAHLAANLRNLLSGRLARRWMEDSREALELRLMALSGSVLQDGGEPVADFARHLPDEDWKRLVGEFLLSPGL